VKQSQIRATWKMDCVARTKSGRSSKIQWSQQGLTSLPDPLEPAELAERETALSSLKKQGASATEHRDTSNGFKLQLDKVY
jgi:hypothetical protein